MDENLIKQELFPLYQELLSKKTFEDICAFCIQWGENFPSAKNEGILFIGKAVNKWISKETDVNILFGDDEKDKIFARDDQIQWVDERRYDKASAFWSVIKKTTQNFYPKEDWYSYVAWSNLWKLAPFKGGNPNVSLRDEQFDTCKKILEKEIEIFSPKFVVMLTSGWETDFLYFLNSSNHPQSELTIKWWSTYEYETRLYKINDVAYIVSPHPQGKKADPHVEAVSKLIHF